MFIGQDITRVDALDKVLGKAAFAHDLTKNTMLFACVVRSSRPHAVLKRIDVSAARALEGVVKIISHEDIPGENLFGAIKKDQPFLAAGRVRYKGEAILIVVAATEETARRASELVRIEYEDLENISDPFLSIQSPVLIHDGGNLLSHRKVIKGDAAKAFESSDVIVENTYSTTWIDHAYMETEAGLGYLDDRGRMVVASSTQNIHYKMKEISRLLAIPPEEVRVVQATTGGGFGGKLDVTVEGYLALAVWHTKRPVFMRYTREESLLAQTKRHPLYIVYKTGARKDGSLTAVEVNIVGDTGPYNSYGETVCLRAAVHATGPYEVPNVLVNSRMFYTNNPVAGAMRGFGVPQLALAHESQLDEIAGLIGMDPLDIRMKNALKRGSLTATSQVLNHSAGLLETLKAIEPAWRERRKERPGSGFGLGCMYYGIGNTGISNPSSCYLTLTPEGRVEMHSGVCDIGQGSDTVLLQILCDALGMEEMGIDLVRGDTDTSYDAGSTSASRQTYISGMAVCDAAQKLKKYLKEQGYYDGKPLKDICRDAADKGVPIFEGYFDPPTTAPDPETSQGAPYATYAFATHMTEVDVDEVTGVCKAVKVHAAHDVGRAINVSNVKGQIYGGVAMGIGLALMEEFIPGKSESFDNYYLPTSMDMPEVEAMIVEDREPTGPFGAKGVGEPALIPQAAAVVNAIYDATGIRMRQLPCDIERLKLALEKDKENKR